jgi:hypothetical protein
MGPILGRGPFIALGVIFWLMVVKLGFGLVKGPF